MRKKMKRTKMLAAVMLVVTISVWLAGNGIVQAASIKSTFYAGGEAVSTSLSGDMYGVTGSTSYTKGPGEVAVRVSGRARKSGGSLLKDMTTELASTNTPGGASQTMTPPNGYVLDSVSSHHYATINGESNYCESKLF